MRQRRSPRMENGYDADPGAQVFGIGRDRDHCLGRRLEQDVVDRRLVLIGDVGDGRRQGEYQVIMGAGKSSASRSASHALAAAPWHLGQCRLRQELYAIRVCEQSSQRATCPPSAAVRQFSIAAIAFNWPRLTWPALALRQAGPWARKISATSKTGRATRSRRYAGGSFLPGIKLSCSSGLVTSRIVLTATRV